MKTSKEASPSQRYYGELRAVVQLAGEHASPVQVTVGSRQAEGTDTERVTLAVTATAVTMTVREALALRDALSAAIRVATGERRQSMSVNCHHDDN